MHTSPRQRRAARWLGIAAVLVSLTPAAFAQTVFDDFEGGALDPRWSQNFIQSGSITLTSSGPVKNGAQSLQLTTTNTGVNKYVYLRYPLATASYGRASVWVYDTGADVGSSNYIAFAFENVATLGGQYIDWLGTYDYDLGFGNGGSFYYHISGLTYINTPTIDRTPGWHHWVLDSRPDSFSASIDGAVVFSDGGGRSFDRIALSLSGPAGRPAWTVYFDDFQFTPYVPAPTYQTQALYDPERAVKSGATLPIKIQVCDSSGNNLSAATLAVHAQSVVQISSSISGPVQDAGNANPDNDFRYDATLNGYIFNLKTTGLTTGTYELMVTIGGGSTTFPLRFQVK